jgi:hypothetical protein
MPHNFRQDKFRLTKTASPPIIFYMAINTGLKNLKEILNQRRTVKPPAYEWQDLALRVIKELGVPKFKKNAVFMVCRYKSKALIEKAINETKELAQGEKWKYFFKVLANKK